MPTGSTLTQCLTEADCPYVPRAIPPGGSRFRLGQRVRVIPHDCSDPKLHWESRVTGWSDFHRMVDIATRWRWGDPRGDNPCSAEWVYGDDSLTPLEGAGPDWADTSRYAPGARVRFRWDNREHLHYRDRTLLTGVVEAAHIHPGDWQCTFVVPGHLAGDKYRPLVVPPWRFKIVVNESDFL